MSIVLSNQAQDELQTAEARRGRDAFVKRGVKKLKPIHFRRLERAVRGWGGTGSFFQGKPYWPRTWADYVAAAIRDKDPDEEHVIFWRNVAGRGRLSIEFLKAFVDAALEDRAVKNPAEKGNRGRIGR